MRHTQSLTFFCSYCLLLCVYLCAAVRMYVRRMVNLFHSIDTGETDPTNKDNDEGGIVTLKHQYLVGLLRVWP